MIEFTRLKDLANKYQEEHMDVFLTQLVECVEKYTRNSLEEIKQEICGCEKSKETLGKIYTVLLPETDEKKMKAKGWYTLDDTCSIPEKNRDKNRIDDIVRLINQEKKLETDNNPILGHVYFECDGKQFASTVFEKNEFEGCFYGKSGKEYRFTYAFQYSDTIIKRERILGKCAKYYPIKTPIVFNPIGRRSATVYILSDSVGSIPEEIMEIDLCYENNHLNSIIKEPRRLYWNVKVQKEDIDYVTSKTGEELRRIITFNGCESNCFVIPAKPADIISIDTYEKKKVIHFRDEYTDKFIKITVENPSVIEDSNCPVYENRHVANDYKMSVTPQIQERVRSEADIVYAMKQLGDQLGIVFERVSENAEDEYQPACSYSYECKYRNYDTLRNDKMRIVYLYFINTKRSPFADDYINYICDYMTGMYPDFQWRGGYR